MLPDLTRRTTPEVAAPLGLHWGSVPPLSDDWSTRVVESGVISPIKEVTFTAQPSARPEEQALVALKHLQTSPGYDVPANITFFAEPKHSSAWNANNMHNAFTLWHQAESDEEARSRFPAFAKQLYHVLHAPTPLHVFTVGFAIPSNRSVQAVGLGLYKTRNAAKLNALMLIVTVGHDERAAYMKWINEYKQQVGVLKG